MTVFAVGIGLKQKLPLPEFPADETAVDRELFRMIRKRFIDGGLAFEAGGSRYSSAPRYDLQHFIHQSAMRVAVISPGDQFRSDEEVRQIADQTKNGATPAELVLFVDYRINFRPASVSHPAYIQFVTINDLETWIAKFVPPLLREGQASPPRKRTKGISASKIKANLDTIIITAAGLELSIQERLDELKNQRKGRNSKEAIAECDAAISDYETILSKVSELQREIAAFKNAKSDNEHVNRAASTLNTTVEKWWAKDGGAVLTNSANAGVVISMIGILSLMGVGASIATIAATALVGGKSVAGALKGLIKINMNS